MTRIDVSSVGEDGRIDRREFYDGSAEPTAEGAGTLLRVEADTNGDGRWDKWETYERGELRTAEFDENGDGRPDRRLTYASLEAVVIETEPDATGAYRRRVEVRR